jgi:hypothetical protein
MTHAQIGEVLLWAVFTVSVAGLLADLFIKWKLGR